MKKEKRMSINERIVSKRVFLIDDEGKKLGEFLTRDAMDIAKGKGLDLVEVRSGDKSICKIMDYSKFLYDRKKKQKASKANQTLVKTKEVKISPRIADHDFEIKLRRAKKFIDAGHKVSVFMHFKNTDLRHKGIGRERFEQFCNSMSDVAKKQQDTSESYRNISVYLLPL